MRWLTHQVGALGAAFLLHLPPAGIVAAWFGGILPDVFDQKLANLHPSRQTGFNRVHRGFTHWPGLWIGLMLVSIVLLPKHGLHLLRPVCVGLSVGGLSHVLLDMLTPQGIPLSPFSRRNRFSIGLCRTGSAGENIFLFCLLAAIVLFLGEDVLREGRHLLNFFLRP